MFIPKTIWWCGVWVCKNVVWQIEKLLSTFWLAINKRVFYVGDEPTQQIEWINAFSIALVGRKNDLDSKNSDLFTFKNR